MSTLIQTRSQSKLGLLLILCSSTLWGTIGIATEAIYRLAETNPLSIGFLRMGIASPVLISACWFMFGKKTLHIKRSDLNVMLFMGLSMALYQVFYFAAIIQTGVIIASLITLCLAPILVVFFSIPLLGEILTKRVIVALVVALLGILLLVGVPDSSETAQPVNLLGVLLSLAATLGYVSVTLCGRVLSNRYHPLQPITIGFTASALLLLPFALANGLVLNYPITGWLWLLHMGLIPTALAYIFFFYGIRHITASVAAIVMLIEPLTSTVLAWFLFGERLNSTGFVGAVLLLGALGLLYSEEG